MASSAKLAREFGFPSALPACSSSESDLCGICQDPLFAEGGGEEAEFVGCLDVCEHRYHFGCIQEGCKFQSMCPECRGTIKAIAKYSASSGNLVGVQKVRRKKLKESEIDADIDVPEHMLDRCAICEEGASEEEEAADFLCCDGMDRTCGVVFHMFCLGYKKLPKKELYCAECAEREGKTSALELAEHNFRRKGREGEREKWERKRAPKRGRSVSSSKPRVSDPLSLSSSKSRKEEFDVKSPEVQKKLDALVEMIKEENREHTLELEEDVGLRPPSPEKKRPKLPSPPSVEADQGQDWVEKFRREHRESLPQIAKKLEEDSVFLHDFLSGSEEEGGGGGSKWKGKRAKRVERELKAGNWWAGLELAKDASKEEQEKAPPGKLAVPRKKRLAAWQRRELSRLGKEGTDLKGEDADRAAASFFVVNEEVEALPFRTELDVAPPPPPSQGFSLSAEVKAGARDWGSAFEEPGRNGARSLGNTEGCMRPHSKEVAPVSPRRSPRFQAPPPPLFQPPPLPAALSRPSSSPPPPSRASQAKQEPVKVDVKASLPSIQKTGPPGVEPAQSAMKILEKFVARATSSLRPRPSPSSIKSSAKKIVRKYGQVFKEKHGSADEEAPPSWWEQMLSKPQWKEKLAAYAQKVCREEGR